MAASGKVKAEELKDHGPADVEHADEDATLDQKEAEPTAFVQEDEQAEDEDENEEEEEEDQDVEEKKCLVEEGEEEQ